MTWKTKKLDEVCNVDYGTRVVKTRNIPGDFYVYGGGGRTFTSNEYNRENCVIVSRFAMSANCVRKISRKFFLNDSGLSVSIKDENILSQDFLDQFLFAQQEKIYSLGRGQAQRNLYIDGFKEIEIPLPPLSEQKRIVKILDEKMEKIREAKQLREEAIKDTEKILSRTLHEIFEEGKNKGWGEKEIKDVCEHPQYGFTASAKSEKVGPKMLRITDIQDGKVNWSTVPYCKCDELKKYQLKNGDIVFARTGATVGKSFLIKNMNEIAVFASYLIRVTPKQDLTSEFLYYFFQSNDYWNQIIEQVVGGAQPNVNGTKLAKLKILVPSLTEQKQIVKKLDTLSEKLRTLRDLQTSQLDDLKKLEKAYLREAFDGEL